MFFRPKGTWPTSSRLTEGSQVPQPEGQLRVTPHLGGLKSSEQAGRLALSHPQLWGQGLPGAQQGCAGGLWSSSGPAHTCATHHGEN